MKCGIKGCKINAYVLIYTNVTEVDSLEVYLCGGYCPSCTPPLRLGMKQTIKVLPTGGK